MKKEHLVIAADFWADLGNRFVSLSLLDQFIFKGSEALSSLVAMSVVEQTPSIILGPYAGVIVDRIGALRWLAGTLAFKCMLTILLVFTVFPGAVFTLYFFSICGSIFFSLGRLAIMPALVHEEELISLNALNERVATVGNISSPFLAGWIISKLGRNAGFEIAGMIFCISLCTVLWVPKADGPVARAHRRTLKDRERETLFSIYRIVFRKSNLLYYFAVIGILLLGGGMLNFSLPLFFKQCFKGNLVHWGVVLSFYQFGAFLSTFLLPRCPGIASRPDIFAVIFFVLGFALALLGMLTDLYSLSLLMVLFGCCFTLILVLIESLIQQSSPIPHMGKIMSLLQSYKGVCYLGATIGSAWGLTRISVPGFLLAGGLSLMVLSLLMGKKFAKS